MSLFPVSAFAETAEMTYPVTGSCGENLTWSLDESGTLTISGTGEMADYTADGGQPWAGYSAQINSLIIENGVTKLGAFAFDGLSALAAVVFKGSAPQIGQYCFFGATVTAAYTCDASWTSDVLKNYGGTITWSATHTGEEITDPAVEPTCTETGLTEGKHCSVCGVTINGLKTIPATGHSWDDGIVITEPTATSTGVMLYTCIVCKETKTEIISETSIAHGYCGNKVTYVLDANGTLTISGNGAMENYTEDGDAKWFEYREQIKRVIINEGITNIGDYAFSGCDKLTKVYIPDSVTIIGHFSFYYCTALNDISIPNYVTDIGTCAFQNCTGLTNFIMPDSVNFLGDGIFSNCHALNELKLSKNISCITNGLFACCYSLTSVTVPEGVMSINGGAFDSCSNLTSINIPDSVTSIGMSAFYGCSSLTSIKIPDAVTSIEKYTFEGCTSLTSINIPDSVTSIDSCAFTHCSSLINIKISDRVMSIGDSAFLKCTSLKSIKIPDSVTSIEGGAFYECSSLTSINIPDSVTSIGGSAFGGCTSLTSINIPDSVTSIDSCAFAYCSSLINIKISDRVMSIGDSAFLKCTSLKSINIPDSVTSIGDSAFSNCSKLNNIYFNSSAPKIAENSFSGTTATAKYTCDKTWTADVLQNYGGNITWKATHTGEEILDKPAESPTCTKTGFTKETHCSVCGVSISKREVVAALGHTVVIDKPAVAPTYDKTGLTAGSHCSVCKAVITKQKVVPMKLVAAPKKVKAQSAGYASVRISWGKVSYATGYAVYRATSKKGTYKYIGKTSKNYYTDAKRTTGTTYYYKVRAYRTVNKANKYGAYSAIVYAKALPATPVLTAKNAGSRKIKLSWKKISGAHGYEIYRATSKNGKYALAKRVTSGSTLSFTNTRLTRGKTYYYKIRAYRTVKRSRKYGAFSTVKYAKG